MNDMKSKIITRLISGRKWEPGEFWDQLPDVVHSTDIEKKAVWRDDPNHPKYILNKKDTLTKDEAFNAIVEGMKILGWDDKEDE